MKRKFIWLFFTIVALLATTCLSLGQDWSTGQGNFQRTGFHPQALNQARLTSLWDAGSAAFPMNWGEPVVYEDVVYAIFLQEVIAFDINTGATVWGVANNLGAGSSRSTPTVVTTTNPDLTLTRRVYVPLGLAGVGAGIRCIDGLTGLTLWNGLTGAKRVRYSRIVVADIDANGYDDGDPVIVGTENGELRAFDAITGAPLWGGLPTVLDATYWSLFGPSLSADNQTVYAATFDILASGAGRVHAVNAATGAIINSWNPPANSGGFICGFAAAPIVDAAGDVIVATAFTTGANVRIFALDGNVNFKGRSGHNGPMFSNGAIYPDPIAAEDIFITGNDTWDPFGGPQVIARKVSGIKVTGASLYWGFGVTGAVEAPVAVGGNGVAHVASAVVSTFADPNNMYIFDGNAAGGFLYWNKRLLLSDLAGFNRSGAAIVDEASNTAGVVLVTGEGWGAVHAFIHDPNPRARFVPDVLLNSSPSSFADFDIFMNVGTGFNPVPDVELTGFTNQGDAAGTYTLGETELTPSASASVSQPSVRYYNAKPARRALADKLSDELTETYKNKFLGKNDALLSRIVDLIGDEGTMAAAERTTYVTKNKLNAGAATAAAVDWLTVTDLSGGGPIAPGASAGIQLDASSLLLPLGVYYAEVYLSSSEPDENLDDGFGSLAFFGAGGDSIVLPVTFVVGYVPTEGYIEASDAALRISNTGQFGHTTADNFYWNGNDPTQLYGGGLVVVSSDTVWDASYDDHGDFLPSGDLLCDVTAPGSPYVAEVYNCSTAMSTVGGSCSLLIKQYYIGLWDGAFCDSMVIQKNVLCNIGAKACTVAVGYFMDWDIPPSAYDRDSVRVDVVHQIIYVQNVDELVPIFGLMRKPSDDTKAFLVQVDNPTSIYNTTAPIVDDTLRKWFATANGTFEAHGANTNPDDKSIVAGVNGIIIQPGECHLEEYIIFGWDSTDVVFDKKVWKVWLRQEGFYRGDVNTDNRGHERDILNNDLGPAPAGGQINIIDLVYLANYIFKGSASPWPFTDQGDVNCDGVVALADLVALANYVFKGTNVPVDKNRFLPLTYQADFSRNSIWEKEEYR